MTEEQSEFDRAVEQLAMFENRIDQRESGTIPWQELDVVAREQYLKEARLRIGALGLLGWAPLHPYGALYLRDPRDTLKMLRETLALAQTAIPAAVLTYDGDEESTRQQVRTHTERIGRIIAEIDRQRPLGPDGKHGDLHTPTCGCEDRP